MLVNSSFAATVNTGNFMLDGGAMFGVVPKVIWNNLNPANSKNLCNWAMRCLVVSDGARNILIDTGIGDKQSEKFFSYYDLNGDDSLAKSLQALHISPDDITDVVLTHLHFDHCGGAINKDSNGKLYTAFKNALYWSSELHWQAATHPNAREKASFLKENIQPIAESGQLRFIEKHGNEFPPNMQVRLVFGHTEAMMLPQFQYKGKTILYMADLIPSVAHIPLPYVMAYDIAPLLTMNEKTSFLTEAAENEYVLFFEHDLNNECCTVQKTEKGIAMKDVFAFNSL